MNYTIYFIPHSNYSEFPFTINFQLSSSIVWGPFVRQPSDLVSVQFRLFTCPRVNALCALGTKGSKYVKGKGKFCLICLWQLLWFYLIQLASILTNYVKSTVSWTCNLVDDETAVFVVICLLYFLLHITSTNLVRFGSCWQSTDVVMEVQLWNCVVSKFSKDRPINNNK